jgi:membrane-associated protein
LTALTSLQVGSLLSYAIAVVLPALDAIFPALPSETVVIALGVATAGSTDPRLVLLVGCAAVGAFAGDNLCYLLGRRFGPWAERRFFRGERGAHRRAWAEGSLERFGMPLIVACRFVPGGRTAVTLCCGIVGYDRRRFVIATALAGTIWAVYSFFLGRLGGQAFDDKPWAGLLLAFGAALAVSGLIEVIRRIRAGRSGRHAGQVEADHPGEYQADRDQLRGGNGFAEEEHADHRGPGGADPGPHRVRGSDLELAQGQVSRAKLVNAHTANQIVGHSRVIPWLSFSSTAKPVSNKPATTRINHGIALPFPPRLSTPCLVDSARARKPGVPVMEPGWSPARMDIRAGPEVSVRGILPGSCASRPGRQGKTEHR